MPCHDETPEGRSAAPPTRPRYFTGQLLTPADFTAEQDYHVTKHRLHNRGLHGWGIVCGLEMVAAADGSVTVSPGIALDRLGREIVVPAAVRLDPGNAESGEVVIRYAETAADVRAGGEASRVVERYEVVVQDPGSQDPLAVGLGRIEHSAEGTAIEKPAGDGAYVSVGQLVDAVDTLATRVASLEERLTAVERSTGSGGA